MVDDPVVSCPPCKTPEVCWKLGGRCGLMESKSAKQVIDDLFKKHGAIFQKDIGPPE